MKSFSKWTGPRLAQLAYIHCDEFHRGSQISYVHLCSVSFNSVFILLDVLPTVMHKQKPVPPVFYWAIYQFFQIISRLLSISKNRCRYQGLVPV